MRLLAFAVTLALSSAAFAQQKPEALRDTSSDLLWKKLETRVEEIANRLDGVMGVAILDLTDGRILLHNGDRVFPTASSIKIAILLELYRQDQEARTGAKGKAKLNDTYTFDPKDLVEDSRVTCRVRGTKYFLSRYLSRISRNRAAMICCVLRDSFPELFRFGR